jgi:hypothetical protein
MRSGWIGIRSAELKMKHVLFAAICSGVMTLAACATTPAYGPAPSNRSAGYSDQRIENDRWRVTYRGDTRMRSAEVQDFALMRAAEITMNSGAQWFEVLDSDTDADPRRRYSIETDFGTDYVYTRNCSVLGCTVQAVPVLTRVERERVDTRTVYEHTMEIRAGSGPRPGDSSRVYNARDTFANLSSRLG